MADSVSAPPAGIFYEKACYVESGTCRRFTIAYRVPQEAVALFDRMFAYLSGKRQPPQADAFREEPAYLPGDLLPLECLSVHQLSGEDFRKFLAAALAQTAPYPALHRMNEQAMKELADAPGGSCQKVKAGYFFLPSDRFDGRAARRKPLTP